MVRKKAANAADNEKAEREAKAADEREAAAGEGKVRRGLRVVNAPDHTRAAGNSVRTTGDVALAAHKEAQATDSAEAEKVRPSKAGPNRTHKAGTAYEEAQKLGDMQPVDIKSLADAGARIVNDPVRVDATDKVELKIDKSKSAYDRALSKAEPKALTADRNAGTNYLGENTPQRHEYEGI